MVAFALGAQVGFGECLSMSPTTHQMGGLAR